MPGIFSNLRKIFSERTKNKLEILQKSFDIFVTQVNSKLTQLENNLAQTDKTQQSVKEKQIFFGRTDQSVEKLQQSFDMFVIQMDNKLTKLENNLTQINITQQTIEQKLLTHIENVNTNVQPTLTKVNRSNGIHSKKLKNIHEDLGFLYRTVFGEEPWLAASKNLHKGKRCFLLGCGPSINMIDISRLKNEFTMGVNGICLIPEINLNYYVSVSKHWWQWHKDKIIDLKCSRKFFPDYLESLFTGETPVTKLRTISKIDHVRYDSKTPFFFSKEAQRYVCLGGSVTTVCLQLLYHMGFKEVILLGIDHNYDVTQKEVQENNNIVSSDQLPHFQEGYYPNPTDVHVDIEAMERGYILAEKVFRNEGRRILNASPGTKVNIFQKVCYSSLFSQSSN